MPRRNERLFWNEQMALHRTRPGVWPSDRLLKISWGIKEKQISCGVCVLHNRDDLFWDGMAYLGSSALFNKVNRTLDLLAATDFPCFSFRDGRVRCNSKMARRIRNFAPDTSQRSPFVCHT